MQLTPRRIWFFVRAYLCLLLVHRTLRKTGFKGAQSRFLRAWKRRSQPFSLEDARVRDAAWAVDRACAWQWQRSVCLHRSLTTYVLLRAFGAQPQFIIGVMNRPFGSHAWVEVEGNAIADNEMNELRYHYKPTLKVPSTGSCSPQKQGGSVSHVPFKN